MNFTSEYHHKNKIEARNGKPHFMMDCSGFVAHYIGKLGFLRALAELKNHIKKHNFLKINRFYCQDFDGFLKSDSKYWEQITTPDKGDIIVIIFEDGENSHYMIIDSIIDKNTFRVLDSTRHPHKNDTRKTGETGIGFGEIKIHGDLYDSQNPNKIIRKSKIYFVRPKK